MITNTGKNLEIVKPIKKAPSLGLSYLSTKDIKYAPLFFQHDGQSKELLRRQKPLPRDFYQDLQAREKQ